MAWTEKEIKDWLDALKDGVEFTVQDISYESGWHPKDIQNLLIGYKLDRDFAIDRYEVPIKLEDYFLAGTKRRFPIYKMGVQETEADEPYLAAKPPGMPTFEVPDFTANQIEVFVPVNQRYAEYELINLLQNATGDNLTDTKAIIEWWQEIGHARRVEAPPLSPHDYHIELLQKGPAPGDEIVIEMHTLPQKVWDSLKFYAYLRNTFGWSNAEAQAYFRGLEGKKTTRTFRKWSLPIEIPIEVRRKRKHLESKPRPNFWISPLHWFGSKEARYNQENEIDAFIMLPRAFREMEVYSACRDLIQRVLDQKSWPEVDEVLKWHKADIIPSITTERRENGRWIYYYKMEKYDDGSVGVKEIYDEHGVST